MKFPLAPLSTRQTALCPPMELLSLINFLDRVVLLASWYTCTGTDGESDGGPGPCGVSGKAGMFGFVDGPSVEMESRVAGWELMQLSFSTGPSSLLNSTSDSCERDAQFLCT